MLDDQVDFILSRYLQVPGAEADSDRDWLYELK